MSQSLTAELAEAVSTSAAISRCLSRIVDLANIRPFDASEIDYVVFHLTGGEICETPFFENYKEIEYVMAGNRYHQKHPDGPVRPHYMLYDTNGKYTPAEKEILKPFLPATKLVAAVRFWDIKKISRVNYDPDDIEYDQLERVLMSNGFDGKIISDLPEMNEDDGGDRLLDRPSLSPLRAANYYQNPGGEDDEDRVLYEYPEQIPISLVFRTADSRTIAYDILSYYIGCIDIIHSTYHSFGTHPSSSLNHIRSDANPINYLFGNLARMFNIGRVMNMYFIDYRSDYQEHSVLDVIRRRELIIPRGLQMMFDTVCEETVRFQIILTNFEFGHAELELLRSSFDSHAVFNSYFLDSKKNFYQMITSHRNPGHLMNHTPFKQMIVDHLLKDFEYVNAILQVEIVPFITSDLHESFIKHIMTLPTDGHGEFYITDYHQTHHQLPGYALNFIAINDGFPASLKDTSKVGPWYSWLSFRGVMDVYHLEAEIPGGTRLHKLDQLHGDLPEFMKPNKDDLEKNNPIKRQLNLLHIMRNASASSAADPSEASTMDHD